MPGARGPGDSSTGAGAEPERRNGWRSGRRSPGELGPTHIGSGKTAEGCGAATGSGAHGRALPGACPSAQPVASAGSGGPWDTRGALGHKRTREHARGPRAGRPPRESHSQGVHGGVSHGEVALLHHLNNFACRQARGVRRRQGARTAGAMGRHPSS